MEEKDNLMSELQEKAIKARQAEKYFKDILNELTIKTTKISNESKILRTREVKEFVENIAPNKSWDGSNKWSLYHKNLGKLISEQYLNGRN
jgi:hypothetical protein